MGEPWSILPKLRRPLPRIRECYNYSPRLGAISPRLVRSKSEYPCMDGWSSALERMIHQPYTLFYTVREILNLFEPSAIHNYHQFHVCQLVGFI